MNEVTAKRSMSVPNAIGVVEASPMTVSTSSTSPATSITSPASTPLRANLPQNTVTVMSALHHTLPARNALNAVTGSKPSSLTWEGVVEVPVGVTEVTVRLAVVKDVNESSERSSRDGRGLENRRGGGKWSLPSSPSSSSASPSSAPSPSPPPWTLIKYATETHVIRLGNVPSDVVATCAWVDESHPGGVLGAAAFSGVFFHTEGVTCEGRGGSRGCNGGHSNANQQRSGCTNGVDKNPDASVHVTLEVMDLELEEWSNGNSLCVTGGNKALGNWQAKQVVWMDRVRPGHWQLELDIPISGFPITYKYAIGVRGSSTTDLILEPGENRLLVAPIAGGGSVSSRLPSAAAAPLLPKPVHHYAFDGYLRRQERWRAAGIALPVFSIRNKGGFCGQFSDLPALGAWCKSCGFSLLQLLPVCDTSVKKNWRDSYPYSSLCVFALHPMYLDVSDLMTANGYEHGVTENDNMNECMNEKNTGNKSINISNTNVGHVADVDYEATMAHKLGAARQAFDECGEETLRSKEYEAFRRSNAHWLLHYAVFCFLRDFFRTAEHWKWGVYAKPTAEMIEHLTHPDREWYQTIRFHCYLQFKLHQQLYAASRALKKMGVVLKGDLPIGVDKCSVDTWQHPKLFRMHTNTGAPPDYFDPKGQNWGFPTYNWEAMAEDDYAWWRQRLAHMSQYFQAYRIDHILGFFRIWELPGTGKTGILGRYRPSLGYTRAELERQGLWDIDRLADPFITDELLHELLDDPEVEHEVKMRFLEPSPGNRYRFKDRYNSESAMFSLKCRPGLPDATALDTERTRAALILLSQNVCLIKDQDDPHNKFYPRFNLVDTASFQYLHDEHWKNILRSMHDESFFGSRSDYMWREQALQTLPMMQGASDMLVCGEDLGFIPPCVHPIMEELGIVGLRIQRMPSEEGEEFGDPESYGYMTVASPSSHDTTNFRAWYLEDEDRRDRYCAQFGLPAGDAPGQCSPDTVRAVVRQHLNSPSMLAIFSIQDIIGMSRTLPQRDPDQETINVPSNPEHYWRYRMHVSVADLVGDQELTSALRALIQGSGRLRGE